MDAVRNYVARHLITSQAPPHRPGRPMVQRWHRIHEVCHVPGAGLQSLIENRDSCACMPDGNDPSASPKFGDQFNTAFDLRSDRHHMDRAIVLDPGKGIQGGSGFKSPKVLAMKCAALFAVNKRTFVMNAKNAR